MGDDDFERTLAAPGTNAPAQLLLNSVIGGQYRLLSLIGRGGMGVVYRARHQSLNLDVALKVLAPEQLNQANWQRFQSEGRAIARLAHPNIVKIYDMGVVDGVIPYYVMDLLEGQSLAELIAREGRLDPQPVVEIFLQICAGLQCAHQAGLIHRDVKPSNIILVADGKTGQKLVKLVDFGLVKVTGATGGANQSQTATGEVFGSPLYMSPEQCLGEKVDLRSDIYSLGCTLFEALTGKPPFKGETAISTVLMHQTKVPPRLSDAASIKYGGLFAADLERLVASMLAKRQDDRQSSMEEVAIGLRRFAEGKTVKPEAVFQDGPLYAVEQRAEDLKSRMMMVALGLTVVALIISLAIFFPISGQKSKVTEQQIVDTAPPLARETDDMKEARAVFAKSGPIMRAAEMRDGRLVRRLHFPSTAIGIIGWDEMGADEAYHKKMAIARGIVEVPASGKLRLKIAPPDGDYTLEYPFVLRLFGPNDVKVIAFESGDKSLDLSGGVGFVEMKTIKPEVFRNIADWTDLEELKVHNFTITTEAFKAIGAMHPVKSLKLDADRFNVDEFLQLPWLNKIRQFDLRRARDIDKILAKLGRSGVTSLIIHIADTTPGVAGLTDLKNCYPTSLVLDGCGIDDARLEVIGQMTNLTELSLTDNKDFASGSLLQLTNLKKLARLNLKGTNATVEDRTALMRAIPGLQINYK